MTTVRTFDLRTDRPDRIARSLADVATAAPAGTVGLVFLTGALTAQARDVASGLAALGGETDWLVAGSSGALTERGDVEGEDAAAALVVEGSVGRVVVGEHADGTFGTELGRALAEKPGVGALALLANASHHDAFLFAVEESAGSRAVQLLGAGTMPRAGVHLCSRGSVRSGEAGALLFDRLRLQTRSSAACRLLSPLLPVSRTRGALLLELEGMSALSLLAESARDLEDQPLVLVAVAAGPKPLSRLGRTLSLRPIQGVDPGRGGILLADELPLGTQVAFAVRDAHSSRTDLEAHLDSLRKETGGSAPALGIYVSCAGRGRGLYRASDVDVRLIRSAFPGVPLIGLHSAFEISPLDDRLTLQVYAGVLGMLSAPS